MDEFGFELRLCAHLEATEDVVVARQLGGGVSTAGRVIDVVVLEPGPAFEARTRLTSRAIPQAVLDADLGPGRARDWRRVMGEGMAARRAVERAHEIGFLELEHDAGRELARPVGRYPPDWFSRLVAIENKPDLGEPGDLYEQLQFDVSLALVDAVVLATASHVTRAHVNRLPDAVGIWRFDPDTGDREVRRDPASLPTDRPGLEVLERHPGRTEVRPIGPGRKARARRRLAERAYGKGWRTYTLPPCANIDPAAGATPGLPACTHFDRLVNPASACGSSCPGYRPGPPPAVDLDELRDRHSPWVAAPPERRWRQGRLGDRW